ncbi:mechanosensitive ion channel [Sagittula sp. NFXS13]|uniref:mechanosensitive ion channel domain-containing protein n=1 Tax=Sagittula sp. NFXS13 TaxID=2819095 RepID=UPI0032DF053D
MTLSFRQAATACFFALTLFLTGLTGAMAQSSADATASDTSGAANLSAAQAGALADLLSDDATREALLEALNRVSEGTAKDLPEEAAEVAATEEVSLSRRVARTTQDTAERVGTTARVFWGHLSNAPEVLSSAVAIDPAVIWDTLRELALVIVATVLIYNVLRLVAKRLFRKLGSAAHVRGPVQSGFIILASVLIDAVVVVLAWGAGYLLALMAFGSVGQMGIQQTLYLNAFLMIEMAKMVVRALLSPTTPDLRLMPIPDRGAKYVNRWTAIIVSILGYGQLLVVPIINQNVNFLTGRGVSTLISFIAIVIVMVQVVRFRRAVSDWLLGARLADAGNALRFLARNWYVVALVYLVALLAVVLARPGGVLFPLLGASAKVLAAIIVAFILSNLVGSVVKKGIKVPATISQRLPLLERRLNAFIPKVLKFLRLAILAAVIFFTLSVIGLLDVQGWLESQVGMAMTGTIIAIFFILVGAFLVWLAVNSWVDFRLNPDFGSAPTSRESTLLSLLRNAVTIVLVVITLMFVLSEVGIDIAPLIASAGVLGLAIGFGAQKMVQDIITGVFIQLENAMNVGDVVTVGGTTGTVERLTIRSVSLRDLHGAFHIIPFSSVDMVSNYMREFAFFVADMGIAYRENVQDAKQAMMDGFDELRANEDYGKLILDDLQWFGLNSFGSSDVVVRARIKTVPGQQWGVGRAYNEILKRIFDERGIEIPFPHQTIYFGEDKEGNAPAAPIRIEKAPQNMVEATAKPAEQADDQLSVDASPDDEPPGDTGR